MPARCATTFSSVLTAARDEGSDQDAQALQQAQDRFIATWSQMGSAWGISRSVAEVHALLFITGQTMCTDDVMERLGISRGSASMSIRSLLDWHLLSRTHKRSDRKEYFNAEQDIWAMFRAIVAQRKKREIDPLVESLEAIRDLTRSQENDTEPPQALVNHNHKLDDMLTFFELMQSFCERFIHQSPVNADALDTIPQRADA